MDRFLFLEFLLVLAAVGGIAVGSHVPQLTAEEVYWQKVLPNVPMPSALQDLIHPGRINVNVNPVKYAAGNLASASADGNKNYNKIYAPPAGNLASARADSNKNYNKIYGPPADSNKNYNKIYAPPADGNKNYNKIYAPPVDGNKNYNKIYGPPAVKKKQSHHFHNDPTMSLFFQEKDLQPGAVKSMLFVRNVVRSTFIPRREADSLPFSSTKLPEILNHFSIKPDSAEAAAIGTTLSECEMPEFQGEHKFCATSLESLVESSMSALGTRSVQAVSTYVSNEGTPMQPYTVAASGPGADPGMLWVHPNYSFWIRPCSGLKRLPGSDTVACHSSIYPYVVYYCHSIKGTRAYRVSLTGKSGTKVDAVAVCHTETDHWNPEHVAFQVLNVKPGAVICHFLPQDNLLWTPTK